ncbi:MAG: PIN domain nuclease [Candidatus Azotimanducaceae bacterium WSBS_2022_MAG_OTU7]
MILVDSSVWIDYFNGQKSTETDLLDELLASDAVCLGDIILSEVLQGFRSDTEYRQTRNLLGALPVYQMLNPELALKGADNYRKLRKKGVTIRKTVDVWIATYCIENKIPLLFSDRDFIPFVRHLKLASPIKYT